ncbi:hypothetical protein [Horticoccus sp. 23ND18S-11]|uniref:hypothetical protein n=1 Tax=Horticoccus sp. 23ND18S-11 TaxID=3391832 RepID=UPI0039C8ECAD
MIARVFRVLAGAQASGLQMLAGRSRSRLVVAAGWIAFAGSAFAAPLERELGQRLSYVRVHELPADLPAKPAGRLPAFVADVRYVPADAEGAKAFLTWVKERASARSPVFVLANAATSSELLKLLGSREKIAGVVVVGIEAPGFKPDVVVRAAAEDERRTYNALEQGAEIATLLTDHPDKVRHDEASLSKDRPEPPPPATSLPAPTPNSSSPVPAANTPPAASAERPAGEAVAAKPAANRVDATLQRAVHLHRALVALKKI